MQVWIALAAMAWTAAEVEEAYRRDFTAALMRVDYFHIGTATKERFSLDRIRVEGPWAGNPRRLLDSTGWGKYRFQLVDPESGRVLFSRGFSSIYGEWETTGEAKQEIWRTFPEAVCFPEPRRTVRLELSKRDRRLVFQPVWDILIDPGSNQVDRSPPKSAAETTLMRNGPTSDKVDLLFLGDGYPEEEKFKRDARRLAEALFRVEPFNSRRTDFNVRGLFTPAVAAGVSRPGAGVFRSSPLGASYDALGLKRYILTTDDRAWRNAAASAPSDFVVILVNNEEYGGGGDFQPVCGGGCGFFLQLPPAGARVRASLRRSWRRVLHLDRGLPGPDGARRGALGAEHHGSAGPGPAQMGPSGAGGNAASHSVGQAGARAQDARK